MKNEDADLDSIVYFIVSAYRKNVVPKLESGKQIDQCDLSIIKLVLQINMFALNVFDNAIISVLNIDYNLPLVNVDISIKDTLVKCSNNSHNNNEFRDLLTKWYECFKWIDSSIKTRDMLNIINQKVEHIDRIQGRAYVPILLIPGLPARKKWFETPELRPYKNQWEIVQMSVK